jgi:hypothetical protein
MRTSFVLIVSLALICPVPILCQQVKAEWKEYKSVSDGFSLTVPTLLTPHNSPALPGATAYAIPLKDVDGAFVLRVKREEADCSSVISRQKDRVTSDRNSGIEPSSVREISIEGHRGIEYRWQRSSAYTILERWYCVSNRLYVFSVNWPSAQPFPTEATIILDSFRLLSNKEPTQ